MKKFLLTILIATLVVFTLVPICTSASGVSENIVDFQPHGKNGYILSTLRDKNEQPYGVKFTDDYFGKSNISVTVELYSQTDGFVLDFFVGNTNLSTTQKQTLNKLVELFDWVDERIKHVDSIANTQYDGQNGNPTSDVYRYNTLTSGKIQIDYDTYKLLQISREMYDVTQGAFNPAVYRLVDLWGFSSRIYSYRDFTLPYDRSVTPEQWDANGYPLPEQKYVDAFSNPTFTSFSNQSVTLSEQTIDGQTQYFVQKNVAPAIVDGQSYGQWIDLGGIAKGYVADLIKQKVTSLGLSLYHIDVGGSSQSYGKYINGEPVPVGIIDPFDPYVEILPQPLVGYYAQNKSASTSGQYIRKYVTNGVEYSHIIDGKKGKPAQTGVKSISLNVPDDDGSNFWACKTDCLSTAMTVVGREGIVNFCNDYFQQNNIDVLVIYQTVDGAKQILSNMSAEQMEYKSAEVQNYSWNLSQKEGVWQYDSNAQLIQLPQKNYTWVLIVIAVVVLALFALVLVHRFTKGKQKATTNVTQAKRDKLFKSADVLVYLAVILVIVVLFSVFFGGETNAFADIQTVKVVDITNNQVLFVYDTLRNEYKVAQDSAWNITVTQTENGIKVRFEGQVDNESRFNEMTIENGQKPSVKMTNSICGFQQDCVKHHLSANHAGSVIVCKPNSLKIVTE